MGEGHHARWGGPHAEAVALRRAGKSAKGATAYITLEPCAHKGKTPPCADALIRAGVKEVVYAWADASTTRIEPGDLLTTSDIPGHLMKVMDHPRAQGAILGKAMTSLEQGTGMVLVLVSLQ